MTHIYAKRLKSSIRSSFARDGALYAVRDLIRKETTDNLYKIFFLAHKSPFLEEIRGPHFWLVGNGSIRFRVFKDDTLNDVWHHIGKENIDNLW